MKCDENIRRIEWAKEKMEAKKFGLKNEKLHLPTPLSTHPPNQLLILPSSTTTIHPDLSYSALILFIPAHIHVSPPSGFLPSTTITPFHTPPICCDPLAHHPNPTQHPP
ncbi:hypothetical protein E2C01_037240 [Portunus trituberculatus]|uniref:Uncharacterized protein n=1 Tax=Portunus trituberculatus TaxID=210409 RepID=A0A5B7F7L7_PORTR|nr:hypothetical protein [Portunus trituberculatus]